MEHDSTTAPPPPPPVPPLVGVLLYPPPAGSPYRRLSEQGTIKTCSRSVGVLCIRFGRNAGWPRTRAFTGESDMPPIEAAGTACAGIDLTWNTVLSVGARSLDGPVDRNTVTGKPQDRGVCSVSSKSHGRPRLHIHAGEVPDRLRFGIQIKDVVWEGNTDPGIARPRVGIRGVCGGRASAVSSRCARWPRAGSELRGVSMWPLHPHAATRLIHSRQWWWCLCGWPLRDAVVWSCWSRIPARPPHWQEKYFLKLVTSHHRTTATDRRERYPC